MSGNRAVRGKAKRREQITVSSREGCGDAWVEQQMDEVTKNAQERQGLKGGSELVSSWLCWSSPSQYNQV